MGLPRTFSAFLVLLVVASAASAASPLGHSHNDYLRARPLVDAIERGFASIEVDIFTSANEFLVAHRAADLRSRHSLVALYLNPLARMAREGRLPRDVVLVLDAKSIATRHLAALDDQLGRYPDVISHRSDGAFAPARVGVLLSGEGLLKRLRRGRAPRFFQIEGRLADLGTGVDRAVMPQVAANWRETFTWRGRGDMPRAEKARLSAITSRVHGEGRTLRFWNTPDDPDVWRELRDAGVDVIGTDDLPRLQSFLRMRQ